MIVDQLKLMLAEDRVRVIDLFRTWDAGEREQMRLPGRCQPHAHIACACVSACAPAHRLRYVVRLWALSQMVTGSVGKTRCIGRCLKWATTRRPKRPRPSLE